MGEEGGVAQLQQTVQVVDHVGPAHVDPGARIFMSKHRSHTQQFMAENKGLIKVENETVQAHRTSMGIEYGNMHTYTVYIYIYSRKFLWLKRPQYSQCGNGLC